MTIEGVQYLGVNGSGQHRLHVPKQPIGFHEVSSWRVLQWFVALHWICGHLPGQGSHLTPLDYTAQECTAYKGCLMQPHMVNEINIVRPPMMQSGSTQHE